MIRMKFTFLIQEGQPEEQVQTIVSSRTRQTGARDDAPDAHNSIVFHPRSRIRNQERSSRACAPGKASVQERQS